MNILSTISIHLSDSISLSISTLFPTHFLLSKQISSSPNPPPRIKTPPKSPPLSTVSEAIFVLPIYCFDPSNYRKSSSGFDKTGPYWAKFMVESILRRNLQARGSDLMVRIGKPKNYLLEMMKVVGADAVYLHKKVLHDGVKVEEIVEAVMKDGGWR